MASAQPFTPRKLSSLQQQQRIGIDLRVASNEQLEVSLSLAAHHELARLITGLS